MTKQIDRRNFIKGSLAGAMSIGLGANIFNSTAGAGTQIPRRRLGKTGEMVSILGLGGAHMGRIKNEKESIALIHTALDLGVNFLDSAVSYSAGESERRYGKALKGIRHRAFLMTKSTKRTKKGFGKELHDSLSRFQTDYIDLYQFHSMSGEGDVKTIFGPGGAMEAAAKAQKEGKIRYIGMTSHVDPNLLVLALSYWDGFAAMQFPISVLDPHYLSNLEIIVPKLVEKDIGVLAMKTLAHGNILTHKVATVRETRQFVWTQPVTVMIAGCDNVHHLRDNVQTALDFTPMTLDDQKALLARTEPFKGTKVEYYKRKI